PKCGQENQNPTLLQQRMVYQCKGTGCRYQTSVTSGTWLHRSRLRPSQWVEAVEILGVRFTRLMAWQIRQRNRQRPILSVKPSALQQQLAIGSLDTAKAVIR